MLKSKKKKIFIILLIIVLLIVLFGGIKMIYPKWLTESLDEISEIHLSSEFLDLKITEQKTVMKLYELCKNTEIKELEFDTSEGNMDSSDNFSIVFYYKNDLSDTIKCRKDATVLKQSDNALFWLRGEKNEELLSLLLEIEKNDNSDIIADQEQIFIGAEKYLKEYEQDFNKIIKLAEEDKSSQKEEGGGCISLTDNYLTFHNSKLEEHCLSLIKKTNVLYISFSKEGVAFTYKSDPKYITSIIYNYSDDAQERQVLEMVVKKIKPFYYMECIRIND